MIDCKSYQRIEPDTLTKVSGIGKRRATLFSLGWGHELVKKKPDGQCWRSAAYLAYQDLQGRQSVISWSDPGAGWQSTIGKLAEESPIYRL
ncbi:MAG: hypothetical protein CMJ20_06685 [Phycisphaeraceae bacterium]|nr:hypothetical protein [Phycisphaeraceae bacterium]